MLRLHQRAAGRVDAPPRSAACAERQGTARPYEVQRACTDLSLCGGAEPGYEQIDRRVFASHRLASATLRARRDMRIFLPLQGPSGVRPKAPAIGAWQSPGYKGLTQEEAHNRANYVEWYGMRCDGLVVIDCDDLSAAQRWCGVDKEAAGGWVRKTPRGYHFIYRATDVPGTPDAPAADIFGEGSHIDLRAGRTSQIVFYAPGYVTLHAGGGRYFDPRWLPEKYGVQLDRSTEAWDEVPDGRGNNTMAAFAGAFRKQGMSTSKIAQCLGAINRICMTEDPMSIEEIVEIAKSVSRYAPKPDIDIEVEDDSDS